MLSGQDPDTMCRPSGSTTLRMTLSIATLILYFGRSKISPAGSGTSGENDTQSFSNTLGFASLLGFAPTTWSKTSTTLRMTLSIVTLILHFAFCIYAFGVQAFVPLAHKNINFSPYRFSVHGMGWFFVQLIQVATRYDTDFLEA